MKPEPPNITLALVAAGALLVIGIILGAAVTKAMLPKVIETQAWR